MINNIYIYLYVSAFPWRVGIDYCKSTGSYPIGNVNLSNIASACENVISVERSWIGVVRDQYIGQDQGTICFLILIKTPTDIHLNPFLVKMQKKFRETFF